MVALAALQQNDPTTSGKGLASSFCRTNVDSYQKDCSLEQCIALVLTSYKMILAICNSIH